MSLQRYASLADSGVQWVGQVPSHWAVQPLKRQARLLTEKTDRREHPVALENIEGWTGRFLPTDTEFEGEGVEFKAGDVLFGKLRPYLAKTLVAESNGEAVGDFLVMRPSGAVQPRFLGYQLRSREVISIIDGSTFGSKMPRASWDFVGSIPFPLPPVEEQAVISAFLDRETAKIDGLVEEQKRLIELLKEKRQAVISQAVTKGMDLNVPMKDSGVEWLGKVPGHWALPPLYLRYATDLGKMLDASRITGDHLIPYLRNVDVQWDSINLVELPCMDIEVGEYPRYTVRDGDLLVCEGGEVGRAAVVQVGQAVIGFQKALHRLRATSDREYPRYMFHTFAWAANAGAFAGEGQSTIAHLTGEQLRKYRFPRPPYSEQVEIAAFLDAELGKLGALRGAVDEGVNLLQERRAALISAAVTGKIDVRGIAPQPEGAAA